TSVRAICMTDAQLLREYVDRDDHEAFRQLVGRYADLVYSAAVRQAGRGSAEDITQAVFILLAQKAGRVNSATLAGWLVNATRFTALAALRQESRRQKHEQQAANM